MTDPATSPEGKRPMSPRRKRYIWALGIAFALGAVLGVWLQIANPSETPAGMVLLDNSPLKPGFAMGAATLWIGGMTLCMILYHRGIDDHEERAWLWAGLAAWYAIAFAAPAWWVLHRASLAPAPDAMLLFLGALIVNGAVWLWLKYR